MIVLYQGARGRGKSLSMVKDAWTYHKLGWRIISNMNLKFGDRMTNEGILQLDKNSKIYNAVLVLDEIQIFFDSRDSGNRQNKKFSNFIQQIRKRNVHIFCTTQFTNTVEKRLRQHIDVLAFPEFKKPHYCFITYLDVGSMEDPNIFVTKKYPKYYSRKYDARPIFKLYDTNELIA